MGLDTTHNAWHGPYSSFNIFRHDLAKRIGINLDEYAGYSASGTKDLASINHPIMELLNHSDCEGELTPEQCKRVADGLDMIIKAAPIDEANMPWSTIARAIQFRDGCLEAYSKNEILEFR